MRDEVPEDSSMSTEGHLWSACLQSWQIPVSLMMLWWNSAAMLWPSFSSSAHHHGNHEPLVAVVVSAEVNAHLVSL